MVRLYVNYANNLSCKLTDLSKCIKLLCKLSLCEAQMTVHKENNKYSMAAVLKVWYAYH